MPSTSLPASMASSQARLCLFPAPSSSLTCWSLVVMLTHHHFSHWALPNDRCVDAFKDVCVELQMCLRRCFLCLIFCFFLIRRFPRRPCFLPLLHDTVLLHHISIILPQLVSWTGLYWVHCCLWVLSTDPLISLQVPRICVRRRHFLLLCRDDLCCCRHPGALQ